MATVSTSKGVEALGHGVSATDFTALICRHHDASPEGCCEEFQVPQGIQLKQLLDS